MGDERANLGTPPNAIDLIAEAMVVHWGERCDEYAADCFCCRVWRQFDQLVAQNKLPVLPGL